MNKERESSGPGPRAQRLKELLLESDYEIDIERARSYTAAWRENEGAGPCMRAAYALRRSLEEATIEIRDDELLVGIKTAKGLSGVIPVERGDFNTILEMELEDLLARSRHPFHVTDDEKRELEERILPYWRGRTARSRKIELWKEAGIYERTRIGPVTLYRVLKAMGIESAAKVGHLTIGGSLRNAAKAPRMQRELAGLRPNLSLTVFDVQGHLVPGYRRVLELGFEGIAREAARGLEALGPGDENYEYRREFLESVGVVAEAVREYSNRYAELALSMAGDTKAGRAEELEAISGRCRRVPYRTPRSFTEALQSMWMTQVVLSMSYGMAGVLSPGRVDQYLYPFYRADLRAGLIDHDGALEMIEEYYVKLATELIMLLEMGKDTASELGVGSNTVTIGGLDRAGGDATNDVSLMFLEAHDNLKALANNLSVRVHSGTPESFLFRACASHRRTSGLAFFNDEVIVRELEEDGHEPEDARGYSIVGCVEPTSTGDSFACTAGNDISLAGVLEMALNRGRMVFSGRRAGAKTGDPERFTSFEEVEEAFSEQLAFNTAKLVEAVELLDRAYAEAFPSPLLSSTLEGCVESGRDMTRGGARYNFGSITGRGLGTVADSLAAIRWAVFQERLITMAELMRLLRRNFRGGEALRARLFHGAPKYGNDGGAADEAALWVCRKFADEVRKHRCGRGGFYRPGMFSYGVHVLDGLFLGATPDGRLAGGPVSNGISPVNGSERSGPTAVLRSAALAGSSSLSDGTALNMRLAPGLLSTDDGIGKLASLVSGYFDLGGRHVQFNVVDTDTLRDAQVNPGKYPDLVVRVSGYCAYFTDLGRSIQEDIIARTNFEHL